MQWLGIDAPFFRKLSSGKPQRGGLTTILFSVSIRLYQTLNVRGTRLDLRYEVQFIFLYLIYKVSLPVFQVPSIILGSGDQWWKRQTWSLPSWRWQSSWFHDINMIISSMISSWTKKSEEQMHYLKFHMPNMKQNVRESLSVEPSFPLREMKKVGYSMTSQNLDFSSALMFMGF